MHEAFSTTQVSVGITATKIWSGQAGIDMITIQNLGATQVFIGNAGVSPTTGFPIPGTAGSSITLTATTDIWAIVASGSQTVAILATFG